MHPLMIEDPSLMLAGTPPGIGTVFPYSPMRGRGGPTFRSKSKKTMGGSLLRGLEDLASIRVSGQQAEWTS